MEIFNKESDSEADFDYSIKMALNYKVSWTTLALMLQDMTPTLKQSRQLVNVLLKQLQNLQEKFQNLAPNKITSIMEDEVCNESKEIEILDKEFSADNCSIVEMVEGYDSNELPESTTLDHETISEEDLEGEISETKKETIKVTILFSLMMVARYLTEKRRFEPQNTVKVKYSQLSCDQPLQLLVTVTLDLRLF